MSDISPGGEGAVHHDDAGLEDLLSANDLIRAAEDVLLNEQPLGRVLRVLAENVPPTRHLVLRICNAFDDACDNCTEVQEALAAKQPRTSKSTNLGIVVTKLFGISCSSAYLEKLGKRMSKVQSTMQTTYKKIVKKLDARKAVETKRYKQSGKAEAALEQRLEQLRTATSIEADEFRRKLVDLDCPQEAVEQEAQQQAAAPAAAPAAADAVLAGSRSASSALEAASSLAQLSHHSARAYTCLHCAEHLQARTAARDAADAAQQQAHVAQGLCADAQRDAAEARAEAEKRCAALAQQHELELEDLRSALARAKSRRSDIGKEARKGAEQQRVAAVRARGHQETLAINSHHISMELEGARQAAAAAEQRLAAKVAELKTEQQRRQDDKIYVLKRCQEGRGKGHQHHHRPAHKEHRVGGAGRGVAEQVPRRVDTARQARGSARGGSADVGRREHTLELSRYWPGDLGGDPPRPHQQPRRRDLGVAQQARRRRGVKHPAPGSGAGAGACSSGAAGRGF